MAGRSFRMDLVADVARAGRRRRGRTVWAPVGGAAVACVIALGNGRHADARELLPYDPARREAVPVSLSKGPRGGAGGTLTVRPDKSLTQISGHFYGLNVHPGTATVEFANRRLLQVLKPDAIRLMTNRRVNWVKGKGRQVFDLSPSRGTYQWNLLDDLINQTLEIGAVPYLAIGFGPPSWMTGSLHRQDRKPPAPEFEEDYTRFMGEVAARYAQKIGPGKLRVTIENEPENVGYTLDEYVALFRKAQRQIKSAAPGVQVGGPATGYAMWPQPKGKKLSFSQSSALIRQSALPLDFFDWHIYSHSPDTVLKTTNVVQKLYGRGLPLVISELNRDWRYNGPALDKAVAANTSWDSVTWLLQVYDGLQRQGVDQVFFFAWKEKSLGLVNGDMSELRPNYYVFWALTNLMGRERVQCESGHPQVGCIATRDKGTVRALLYNEQSTTVDLKLDAGAVKEIVRFDRNWYEQHKRPKDAEPSLPLVNREKPSSSIPAGGFVVYEYR